MNKKELSLKIKSWANDLGFDGCAICKAEPVGEQEREYYQQWIADSYQAEMGYMERNADKRLDPTLLVEGAKSIVMLAINYYPQRFQDEKNPQFAYYAYGADYHNVVKAKLEALYNKTKEIHPNIAGRYFCDTAPLLERYWASKAGLGWIGKHSLLIMPRKGSYYFLASIILNIELEYNNTKEETLPHCGNCTSCIDACPTGAIVAPYVVDAGKCLSYQTIENKGEIAHGIVPHMENRVYGCDICQQVCPWNRFSVAHKTKEFEPSDDFLGLTTAQLQEMTVEHYQRIFKGSAIKRAKLSGLKRNIEALKSSQNTKMGK